MHYCWDLFGQLEQKLIREQKVENIFVSQHSRKPIVIGFAFTVAP
jgi:hypothetical protein